ncbi:hypothetical protein CSB45_14460 [candidate division KSB3 bacterium]|uniref:Uncharacterized protein n=1 Tax=candidate division KSB3 bacterium TaxID=2044937 RepID=A0A2G6E0Z2_9BACT|nr:MAG: hypothetical protein CSB45_14460 [candidate division KSB3 bacterium]PIE28404.1 MAG: hypothetical protein CSA57_13900 [candidate division KSB3 bacterium]
MIARQIAGLFEKHLLIDARGGIPKSNPKDTETQQSCAFDRLRNHAPSTKIRTLAGGRTRCLVIVPEPGGGIHRQRQPLGTAEL